MELVQNFLCGLAYRTGKPLDNETTTFHRPELGQLIRIEIHIHVVM